MIDFNFEQGWVSYFTKMDDGLKIHARVYGVASNQLPVVCLAGLTRNSIDFHALALHLAGCGRQVIAIDSRGRGRSDYDPDWTHYALPIELNDVLSVLKSLSITQAIFIGTSRGGMMTMLMGTVAPHMIAGAVLNDIGPVLEVEGLRRIQGYVGKTVTPQSYDEAIKILKFISNGQFCGLSEDEWQYFVRTTWEMCEVKLNLRYDLNIAKPMESIGWSKPLPDMWAAFETLKSVPMLSIRGEHSDLFSIATQQEMMKRHNRCEAFTVKGQGHAPLLVDEASVTRIVDFVIQNKY